MRVIPDRISEKVELVRIGTAIIYGMDNPERKAGPTERMFGAGPSTLPQN